MYIEKKIKLYVKKLKVKLTSSFYVVSISVIKTQPFPFTKSTNPLKTTPLSSPHHQKTNAKIESAENILSKSFFPEKF